MVALAKERYPEMEFFQWDLESSFPGKKKCNVLVCKLVLMFVYDLTSVAVEFAKILESGGYLIICVTHPTYWYHNHLLNTREVDLREEFGVLENGYYSIGKEVRKLIGGDKDLSIKWVIERPLCVNIDNIEIMPIDQTYAGLITHRS